MELLSTRVLRPGAGLPSSATSAVGLSGMGALSVCWADPSSNREQPEGGKHRRDLFRRVTVHGKAPWGVMIHSDQTRRGTLRTPRLNSRSRFRSDYPEI